MIVRERLVQAAREGVVAWEGLVAHGRGEAFDYILGERSVPEALEAERAGTAHLLTARRPVISVNGNVAVLAAPEVKQLAEATEAAVEVNLFHRTEERVGKIIHLLHDAGLDSALGADPDASIPGLDHPRALCVKEGIYDADVVLVPLEDGDRAEALVKMGKVVISVDLNPLSRTSRAATVAIVDDVTRALQNMTRLAAELAQNIDAIAMAKQEYQKESNLAGIMRAIRDNLGRGSG